MTDKIKFDKYKKIGDYHIRHIEKSISQFNAKLYAKYIITIKILKTILPQETKQKIKILDVGCGDGAFFYLLNQKLKKPEKVSLYGIDTSKIALKYARRKNPKVNFKVSKAEELPFKNNFFHIIISLDVIEHIKNPKKMLDEFLRVGKLNSTVIIGTPIRYLEEFSDKYHYHEFFPNEYKSLLSKYFRDIKTIQAHNLRYSLLYNWKIEFNFLRKFQFKVKWIINFLSIYFKRNPFLTIKREPSDAYTYIFGIGTII